MEVNKGEISKKIKSAIKLKLTELGTYIDNELLEYIMVLVANKKTQAQMNESLTLFLQDNAEQFTSWLHDILEKLNTIPEPKTTSSLPETNTEKTRVFDSPEKKLLPDEEEMEIVSPEKSEPKVLFNKTSFSNPKTNSQLPVENFPDMNESSLRQKCLISSVIVPKSEEPKEKEVANNLSSKVLVAPRPRRTLKSQAPRALLLRAVEDANKSVSVPKKRNIEEPEAPRKKIHLRLGARQPLPAESDESEKMKIAPSQLRIVINQDVPDLKEEGPEPPPGKPLFNKEPQSPPVRFTVVMPNKQLSVSENQQDDEAFIALMSKSDDDQECIEEVEEWEEIQTGFSNNKLHEGLPVRKEERCKFWPNCKDQSLCMFVHPTKKCKMFPNCTFGAKCMFIHPRCKFNSECSKTNCPFTHTVEKSYTFQTKTNKIPTKCKFSPNCIDMNCPFTHPKVCHFGKFCRTPNCSFTHPATVASAKFRWIAPNNGAKVETPTNV